MKSKQKPLALVCYLCGRQFGTLSLKIHLKTCKEKFELHQSKKSPQSRIKLPEQPPLLQQILQGRFQQVKQYNEYALNFHKYHILPACPYCHRTFNQDSLQVHLKVCSIKPKQVTSQCKTEVTNLIVKIPRTLVCCVCGRQFGVSSLKIHYPQCLQKYKIEEQKKPKEERRFVGVFDSSQLQLVNYRSNWTYQQIKQFNEKATKIFENHFKIHCKGCKRRFMPEAYNHHLKHCQLSNMPLQKRNNEVQTFKEIKMPKVLVCHICGMQFGISSLLIHHKACKLKFLNNQKLKPLDKRRSLPQLNVTDLEFFNLKFAAEWDQEKIKQFNKIANEVYQKQAMHKCRFCSRTFRQQAYEKHFKYCSNQQKRKQQKRYLQQKTCEVQFSELKVEPKIAMGKIGNFQDEDNNPTPEPQKQQLSQLDTQEKIKYRNQIKEDQVIGKFNKDIEPELVLNNVESEQRKQQILMTFNKNNQQRIDQINYNEEVIKKNQQIQNEDKLNSLFQKLNLYKQQDLKWRQKKEYNQKKINKNSQRDTIGQFDHKESINHNPKSHQQIESNLQTVQIQVIGCKKCGRKFFQQRLLKHESICKGNSKNKLFTTKTSLKKIKHNKQLQEINGCQLIKGIKQENTKQKNTIQSKDIIEIKKDFISKYQQQISKLNKIEKIDQNFDENSRNHKNKNDQIYTSKQEFMQFGQDAVFDSVRCKTCNRNFRIDRIQVHERICQNTKQNCIKMKPHLSQKKKNDLGNIQKTQSLGKRSNPLITHKQSKQKDQMLKTKYTEMLKQIKSRKVNDSDIDRQLEVQLNQFKQQKGATKQNSWNFKLNKADDIVLQNKEIVNLQQGNFIDQPVVGKWKKKRRSGY